MAGIRKLGRGFMGGKEMVTLRLEMYLGAEEPHDSIFVRGIPPIAMTIKDGVQGDLATAALVVNAIPMVIQAPPGLVCVKDLPPVCTPGPCAWRSLSNPFTAPICFWGKIMLTFVQIFSDLCQL